MIELKSAKTPTIGDKIRAMSDEELAEFLFKVLNSSCFGEGVFPYHHCPTENLWANSREEQKVICLKCGLDWLHQPAPISWPHENGMSARGHENIGEVSQ